MKEKIEKLEKLKSLLKEATDLALEIWDGDEFDCRANEQVLRCRQQIGQSWVYARDAKEMLIDIERNRE